MILVLIWESKEVHETSIEACVVKYCRLRGLSNMMVKGHGELYRPVIEF